MSAETHPRRLLVDVGNSRIKWRITDPTGRRSDGTLPLASLDRLAALWDADAPAPIGRVWLSVVAGDAVEVTVRAAVRSTWGDVEVSRIAARPSQCGVVNGYREPERLGSDRWAALIGAHAAFPSDDLLVCSFGTATTIDLLLADESAPGTARFVGGLILPGIEAMRRSLFRETARLVDRVGAIVDFAASTEDAIASGIMTAQTGAITRALADAARRRATTGRVLRCLLAGGDAPRVAAQLGAEAVVIPHLVLAGLEAIASDVADGYHAPDSASTVVGARSA